MERFPHLSGGFGGADILCIGLFVAENTLHVFNVSFTAKKKYYT
jgi:hypothetical protein